MPLCLLYRQAHRALEQNCIPEHSLCEFPGAFQRLVTTEARRSVSRLDEVLDNCPVKPFVPSFSVCGPAGERFALSWVDVMGVVGLGVAAVWLPWPWVVLCVIAPLCEELVFRGGLQETLLRRGWSSWTAIGVTALAFALLHGLLRSWMLALGVLLPALWLGWVYHRSRVRSGPVMAWRLCVAWHAGFNAVYLMSV